MINTSKDHSSERDAAPMDLFNEYWSIQAYFSLIGSYGI